MLLAFSDELEKIAETEKEPNLNLFERHPKKLLGGAAAAVAGGALLKKKGVQEFLRRAATRKKKGDTPLLPSGTYRFKHRKGQSHGTSWKEVTKDIRNSRRNQKALPEKKFKPSKEVAVVDVSSKERALGFISDRASGKYNSMSGRPVEIKGVKIRRTSKGPKPMRTYVSK
jgi:hypothetical protein